MLPTDGGSGAGNSRLSGFSTHPVRRTATEYNVMKPMLRHWIVTCVSWSLSPAVVAVWLLVVLTKPVAVSPTADMQQCPQTLYDCSTLETSLTSVADVILMPDFVSSVHNDHLHVNEICRFLKTPSCSDTVLSECKGEVVYASGAVKARIQYVCGNRKTRKDMQELKSCYHRFRRHFNHCAKKQRKHKEQLEWSPPAVVSPHSWCNLTQEYITCVYSIMALGCALDVADHYMHTVNMSAPVVQAIRGYGCAFGHPLDILRTTSPISVVTSAPVIGPDPSANRPALRSGASGVWCVERRGVSTLIATCVLALQWGRDVTLWPCGAAAFTVLLNCLLVGVIAQCWPSLDPS